MGEPVDLDKVIRNFVADDYGISAMSSDHIWNPVVLNIETTTGLVAAGPLDLRRLSASIGTKIPRSELVRNQV